jgi:toxin YoeB
MEVTYSPNAHEDMQFWKGTNDNRTFNRIWKLIENIQEAPFTGIGKSEPLKYNFSGLWSRRINTEHRIIYELPSTIIIHSLWEHNPEAYFRYPAFS